MDARELKKLQAQFKQKYRDQPQSAMITLRARSKIGEGLTRKIETGRVLIGSGLHPATGGETVSLFSRVIYSGRPWLPLSVRP